MYAFIYIVFTSFCSLMHPMHISVTNMEYNNEKQAFDISVKMFTDDFEKALDYKYGIKANIGKDNEIDDLSGYFSKYAKENLLFFLDGKNNIGTQVKFLKKEMNFEATWLYFELKTDRKIKDVKIKTTFLNDLYPDQKNLLIFTYGEFQEGFQFRSYDDFEEIEL